MELELGLAPPALAGRELDLLGCAPGSCGKRGFGEALGGMTMPMLPLFVCNDGGGDGSGRGGDGETSAKRKRLVGWPPVKGAHRRSAGGGYVKVKMEGVGIGRKLDLSLHASYDDLLATLHRMFPYTSQRLHDDAENEWSQQHGHGHRHPYAVTYEDGDGYWMMIGDVPWDAFVKSAKRLKILV